MKELPSNSLLWTKAEAHDRTVDLFPRLTSITIPREVAERLDIPQNAKLLYGAIAAWNGWVRLRIYQVAGIVGINPRMARENLKVLEEKGLLEIKKHCTRKKSGELVTVSRYRAVPPPRQPRDMTPAPLKGPIKNINERFKEYFHEIDIDS